MTFGNEPILKDIQLHIHCGELTAIIGPNGAGKSTLLKAILGQVPHSGTLQFLDAKNIRSGHPLIRYIPQNMYFEEGMPLSVLDFMTACTTRFPVWLPISRNITQKMKKSLLCVEADHLISKRISELSGGEMQRVLLALALDPVPDLLLLDEPISGVDQKGAELFFKTLASIRSSYDLSILLVSHDLSWISDTADRVVLLNKVIKAEGTPKEVFNSPVFKEIFHI